MLIGKGANPHILGVMPSIRALAGVGEDVSASQAGVMVRKFLIEAVHRLDEPLPYRGREYAPQIARQALELALGLRSAGAEERRQRIILLLGLCITTGAYRKEPHDALIAWFTDTLGV